VAAALEERAARLLQRHITTVRQYDYHRNSFAKAASCYLIHKIGGPRAEPVPFTEAFRRLEGTYHYRWQQAMIHRAAGKWASFSWGSITGGRLSRMCGHVVPARGLAEGLEPLIYLHPSSLIGGKTVKWEGKAPPSRPSEVLYKHTRDDVSLSTAGVVDEAGIDRFYAFFSFDGGPCALFTVWRPKLACTLGFTGMPVFFYARDGITKSRVYRDAQGAQPLEQAAERTSSWWCVNNVLGVAVAGEDGPVRIRREVGYNWARTSAYRDACDTVYLGGVTDRAVAPGAAGVNLAAAFYPDTPAERVAIAAETLKRTAGAVRLPDGWKGLVVPDATVPGKRYLAVANLTRQNDSAAVELTFEEGAPPLGTETMITGRSALVFLTLEGLESFSQTLDLYVESLDGRRIRTLRQTPDRYVLDPVGDEAIKTRLRCTAPDVGLFTVSTLEGKTVRTLPAAQLDETRSFTLELEQPVVISLSRSGTAGAPETDHVAPAVEIAEADIREDGRVLIEVAAQDQSGLSSVELFCDGKSLGPITAPPYLWVSRPGTGAHTYQATAIDASPQKNRRTSFKRTLVVEVGKPAP
jgi:hypothetical protein